MVNSKHFMPLSMINSPWWNNSLFLHIKLKFLAFKIFQNTAELHKLKNFHLYADLLNVSKDSQKFLFLCFNILHFLKSVHIVSIR